MAQQRLQVMRVVGIASRQTNILSRWAGPTTRSFSSSVERKASSDKDHEVVSKKEHVLDKGPKGDPNIQSYESHQGRKNRASATGGTATEQRDSRDSTTQAKKDFPEAPDVVIGMQDERGGKGH